MTIIITGRTTVFRSTLSLASGWRARLWEVSGRAVVGLILLEWSGGGGAPVTSHVVCVESDGAGARLGCQVVLVPVPDVFEERCVRTRPVKGFLRWNSFRTMLPVSEILHTTEEKRWFLAA